MPTRPAYAQYAGNCDTSSSNRPQWKNVYMKLTLFLQKLFAHGKEALAFMHTASLRRRIVLTILLVSILPILLIVVNRNYTLQLYLNQYSTNMQSSISDLSQISNTYFSTVKSWTEPVYSNETFVNYLLRMNSDLNTRNALQSTLNMIFINNPEISAMQFYSNYPEDEWAVTRSDFLIRTIIDDMEHIDYIPGETLLYSIQANQTQPQFDPEQSLFTSTQLIMDVPRNTLLGVITMEVTSQKLDQLFDTSSFLEDEAVAILSADSELLYFKGDQPFPSDQFAALAAMLNPIFQAPIRISFLDTDYLVCAKKLKSQDITILRILPYASLVQLATNMVDRLLWFYVLFIVGIMLFSGVMLYRISKPFKLLLHSMSQVGSGEFGQHVYTDLKDNEILLLINHFNAMSDQIERLFHETYELKVSKQATVLKALQSQINPHFLFNTLQTIHYLAQQRNAYEINKIVDSLSIILRYCLHNEADVVTLDHELTMIDHYLSIQEIRFMDRLKVIIDIPQEYRGLLLPKMTLQPLVENCIVHGVQKSAKPCTIQVSCTLDNGVLHLTVSDDGIGMSPEQVAKIRESLNVDIQALLQGSHIGVRNCWMRLHFFFHDAVDMDLNSQPGQGTTIHINIKQEVMS
jgi:two-component system sensor histidine kinase YesM